MTTWTEIKTDSEVPTSIRLRDDGTPAVSTKWGGYEPERRSIASHYEAAMFAIDEQYSVWCGDSDRVDSGEAGEEVWYPKVLDVQPTHILTIDGQRVASVLPVGDGCEPCELDANSGLSTRGEWLEGISPSYSLVDDVLHCNGSIVVGSWTLDPIERE